MYHNFYYWLAIILVLKCHPIFLHAKFTYIRIIVLGLLFFPLLYWRELLFLIVISINQHVGEACEHIFH